MTDKYLAYIQMMSERDSVMVALSVAAVGLVAGWLAVRGSRYKNWFLVGGVVLYVVTVVIVARMEV